MVEHQSSPSVVVGIDGSRSAIDAALWAVDHAVSRDIPLRLVYAIDPDATTGSDTQAAAHDLATAEIAVRYAMTAVEWFARTPEQQVRVRRAFRWSVLAHTAMAEGVDALLDR